MRTKSWVDKLRRENRQGRSFVVSILFYFIFLLIFIAYSTCRRSTDFFNLKIGIFLRHTMQHDPVAAIGAFTYFQWLELFPEKLCISRSALRQ